MDDREAEEAMPLNQFIAATMAVLGTDADEILVEGAKAFRSNVGALSVATVSTPSRKAGFDIARFRRRHRPMLHPSAKALIAG